MNAVHKWRQRSAAVDSLLCVGLDSDLERLPERFRRTRRPQYAFNQWMIEQTHAVASAYKLNTAFYEARGAQGWHELALTLAALRRQHPEILTIIDAKRADIGSSNAGYVRAFFDELGADALTLHPYLGREALQPFLDRAEKGCIILCRTSNPGAGEFQDALVEGKPLWRRVAERVAGDWNTQGNCMLVVGATYPAELATVRGIVGEMPLLVPGIGAQGGDLGQVLAGGLDEQSGGLVLNASRAILWAGDPAQAAQTLSAQINAGRSAAQPPKQPNAE
ncbi:MAG: orotidine-5'-phosphate decarboxylase [Anaerolineae bacterium]|nr:orotidine-5'-phosphate decarboxylase [Anaerolineae bacterium]